MTYDDLTRALFINRLPSLKSVEKKYIFNTIIAIDDLWRLTPYRIASLLNRSINLKSLDINLTRFQCEQDYHYITHNPITVLETATMPDMLQAIYDPPFLLFIRGENSCITRQSLGVVGTRKPSSAAVTAAQRFGSELAEHNIPLISGLATGIDSAAMQGSAQQNGTVLAVLGSGIDYIYPKHNKPLAHSILNSGGAIISEYPPGSAPLKYHFPARNRIISALSQAILLIEAPLRSGALITADFALQQGKDVYVHSVSLNNKNSLGAQQMVADGARVVHHLFDIITDWGYAALQERVLPNAHDADYASSAQSASSQPYLGGLL